MKKLIVGSLIALAASQAAGCIITSGDDTEDAFITASWEIKHLSPDMNISCPPGYDTAALYNQQVDASGSVDLPTSGKVTFKNAIELSAFMAKAPETRDCMVRQWTRFALGRRELNSEEPSFKALQQVFEKSGYDLREMLVALTKTRMFTHRALTAGEAQ